jgi:hypothetical protein
MTPTFYDSSPVPNAEIEAAADALRTLYGARPTAGMACDVR